MTRMPALSPVLRSALTLLLAWACLGAGRAAWASPPTTDDRDTTPIPALDLPRYMGTWYEVAKYPNRFQRDCARNTRATYTLQPQGTVEVRNRCTRADGSVNEAVGQARHADDQPDGARLEVRFAPAWLSFIPWVWGDYWVVDLDEAYQLVAVSEPGRDYLWILSRTPHVDAQAYHALLHRLTRQGLDITRLVPTSQPSSRR